MLETDILEHLISGIASGLTRHALEKIFKKYFENDEKAEKSHRKRKGIKKK